MSMMMKYTDEHEWLRIEEDATVTVGITDFAQGQLGDLVYVQLPEPGTELKEGEEAAVIESVKAASGILMPVSGTIVEANALLPDDPGKVNEDPQGEGWFFKMKPHRPGDLDRFMDEDAYLALTRRQA